MDTITSPIEVKMAGSYCEYQSPPPMPAEEIYFNIHTDAHINGEI